VCVCVGHVVVRCVVCDIVVMYIMMIKYGYSMLIKILLDADSLTITTRCVSR